MLKKFMIMSFIIIGSLLVLKPQWIFSSLKVSTQLNQDTSGQDGAFRLSANNSSKISKNIRNQNLGIIKYRTDVPKGQKSILFNDPSLDKKWGLKETKALDAWRLSTGSRDIVVAIVDTGIDIHHQDLKKNIWRNPGESGRDSQGRPKESNGIDDDKNGFIDDVHGWNFVHNSKILTDNHGHGTHIAGIIGAEGGDKFGYTGVAPKVSMMILKYFDPKSPGNNLENTIKAFDYATKMNAKIINYSGGGLEFSQKEYNAVLQAQQKGILFVAAAGNERSNSDFHKYYPADYDLENIISVTAVNPQLRVLSSSNFGVHTVDIAAPGENIRSTFPKNKFGPMTGTSQATAFVTGVAALLMAHNRDFDAIRVKKYILKTGDTLDWLKSKTGTSKKLNMYRTLTMFDQGAGASGVIAVNDSQIAPTLSGSRRSPLSGGSLKDFAKKLRLKTQKK